MVGPGQGLIPVIDPHPDAGVKDHLPGGRIKGQGIKYDLLLGLIPEDIAFSQLRGTVGVKAVLLISFFIDHKHFSHPGGLGLLIGHVLGYRIHPVAGISLNLGGYNRQAGRAI